jgi:integrase
MIDHRRPRQLLTSSPLHPLTLTFPLSLEDAAMAARALRLFPDPDSLGDLAPVGITPTGANSLPFDADDAAARRALEGLADEHADELTPLSPGGARAAARLSLPEYFAVHFTPWRETRLAAGTIKRSSVMCERGHMRQYAAWDSDTDRKPAGWPAGKPWTGLPLEFVTGPWLQRFFLDKTNGWPAGSDGWSAATVASCWTSLRTVCKHAKDLGAIAKVPSLPRLTKAVRAALDEDDDPQIVTCSDAELGALYGAVDRVVDAAVKDRLIRCRSPKKLAATAAAIKRELKTALVLGANCGPRPADLFLLEFERHVRLDRTPAEIVFRAAKTGKQHQIPLADVTVAHLRKLRKAHGQFAKLDTYLFPHLTNPASNDPMESDPYRRSVKLLRRLLTAIGLDETAFAKPWHSVARKSCTTRFNAHGIAHGFGSIGKIITHGRDADVASQSYDNPFPTLCKAVATIGWPAEFLKG